MQPFKENLIADVALEENKFDTPAVWISKRGICFLPTSPNLIEEYHLMCLFYHSTIQVYK